MARITSDSISNFQESLELPTITAKGLPLHWPPVHHLHSGVEAPEEGSEQPSAGTSSSTSGSRPEPSGSSVPETGSSLPSPAPVAESLSEQDPASESPLSSSAPSTSGSTQETGVSQPDPSNSSEGQQTAPPSETAATPVLSGRNLMHAARLAYDDREWGAARLLLDQAWDADSTLRPEIEVARQAIATAEASQQSASEETPSVGGFLIQ